MQAKGVVEPLYSVPGNPHNTTVLLDTIAKLKQDVKLCQQEKNAVIEQLNCLISLIKRSWTGDHNASLHLANIVGIPPPEFATPIHPSPMPDRSTRAVILWERLAIKLLDRNYAQIQEEIRQRQMLYMQNRQLYMDEILHSHQMDMARNTTRKNPKTYEEVDRRFINTYSKNKKGGNTKQRVQSAPARPRTAKDMVQGSNMKVKDLFSPTKNGEQQIPLAPTAKPLESLTIGNSGFGSTKDRLGYDDPHRYGQKNLFDLDAVFGPDSDKKPTRPVSAFIPRGQQSRSRPQSGNPAFITQKAERPMKYETTRPISGKGQGRKIGSRLKSTSEVNLSRRKEEIQVPVEEAKEEENEQENEINNNNNHNADYAEEDSDSDFDYESFNKAPIKVRVNSAPKRPAHVDKFVTDLQTMEAMEKDFKKSAISLQKKLGIDMNGMVL